jgi:HSP20 family protein
MKIGKKRKDKITPKSDERKDEIVERTPSDVWTDMDHWFDQLRSDFHDLFWNPGFYPQESSNWMQTPAVDVSDKGDAFEMHVELPGINKDDVNIEVTPHGVEISAEHTQSNEDSGKNWLRKERSASSFYRCFELPEELKTDDVEAEMVNGVLSITLPKKEPTPKEKPKRIKIK